MRRKDDLFIRYRAADTVYIADRSVGEITLRIDLHSEKSIFYLLYFQKYSDECRLKENRIRSRR